MRLKTRPYYALQGLVQTTGSVGGYDFIYADFIIKADKLLIIKFAEHLRYFVIFSSLIYQ